MKHIIFDLDGTLADMTHRINLISNGNKKWDQFFIACKDDKPIFNIIEIFKKFNCYCLQCDLNYKVSIITGRSSKVHNETSDWLKKFDIFPNNGLYMRKDGDYTPDNILKKKMLEDYIIFNNITKDDILCIFEDRDRVVKMWRDNGYTCIQVNSGDF